MVLQEKTFKKSFIIYCQFAFLLLPLHPLSVFGSYFLKVFIDRFT